MPRQPSKTCVGALSKGVWVKKNGTQNSNPGKWKHRLKPAVPGGLILSSYPNGKRSPSSKTAPLCLSGCAWGRHLPQICTRRRHVRLGGVYRQGTYPDPAEAKQPIMSPEASTEPTEATWLAIAESNLAYKPRARDQ